MKIGLCGASCSGKTTLVNEIKNRKLFKGHTFVHEIAASFPIEERKKLETQLLIQQKLIEIEVNHQNLITDRTLIDNHAYFLWYYKTLKHKKNNAMLWQQMMNNYNVHMMNKPYDAIFFIDEFFDMDDSDHREKDKKMQAWTFDIMKAASFIASEVYQIPVYKITGTVDARIAEILKKTKKFYVQKRVTDFM